MKKTVKLEIKPKVKGRPRMTKRGHTYTPPATVEYEKLVADLYCDAEGIQVSEGPVGVEIGVAADHLQIHVYDMCGYADVEGSSRPKGIRGDLDNYAKAVSDALNSVAYGDDKQIEELYVYFISEE